MSENRGHGSEATESRTDERDGSRDRSAGRELQAQRSTHHDTTLLLAARQRMGQKLAERLIALQEQEVAAPIKQETGKVLRSKGKKNHSHEPVRQSYI